MDTPANNPDEDTSDTPVTPPTGARSFLTSGAAYDAFMGRYSIPLASQFAASAGVRSGQRALDVGCGPGALTDVLVSVLGARAVSAIDPSPPFVDACSARLPGVDIQVGTAEAIPFPSGSFDAALAQLVLHFVSDPMQVGRELARVVRPGGTVSCCMWDAVDEMEMLRCFWDAARSVDRVVPVGARAIRFGSPGEIEALFQSVGLVNNVENLLTVHSSYVDFDELWSGFLEGIGPAGQYCVSQPPAQRELLRDAFRKELGSPTGGFTLRAVARSVTGQVPD